MVEIFKDIDYKRHSPSIIFLGVSIALFITSVVLHMDKKKDLYIAQSSYRQQQSINGGAFTSLNILKEVSQRYGELKSGGIVGEAPRLQWIETTQSLSKKLGIPLIDFTLDSAEPLTELNSAYWNSELEMKITPMSLEMDLRHEGEFYRFINALQTESTGLFNVDKCELRRNAVGTGQNPEFAGLKGKCDIFWYSFFDVTADWELSER